MGSRMMRFLLLFLFISSIRATSREQTFCSTTSTAHMYGAADGVSPGGGRFGWSVANVGDLNGDSFTDIAVGATLDGSNRGALHIMLLNGDGSIQSQNRFKSSGGTVNVPITTFFGYSVANIGDLDEDLTTDVAVGANYDDDGCTNCGAIFIVYLTSTGEVHAYDKISQTQGGFSEAGGDLDNTLDAEFGQSVARMGDLDGDGSVDIIAGLAHYDPIDANKRGAVYILFLQTVTQHLSAGGTPHVVKGLQLVQPSSGEGLSVAVITENVLGTNWFFGQSLANYEYDGNQDGIDADILFSQYTGSSTPGSQGRCYLGSFDELGTLIDLKQMPYIGGSSLFIFQQCVPMGDVDGNGVMDIAVGWPNNENGNPKVVYVFMRDDFTVIDTRFIDSADGAGEGNFAFAAEIGESTQVDGKYGMFGWGIAMMGDYNGDGTYDLVVGEPIGASLESDDGRIFFVPVEYCDCVAIAPTKFGADCQDDCLNGGVAATMDSCDCSGANGYGAICDFPCYNGATGLADRCDCTGLNKFGESCNGDCINGVDWPASNFSSCDCTGTGMIGQACSLSCNGGDPTDDMTACNCTTIDATGPFCQTDIDNCESSPCLNDGTCIDMGLTFPEGEFAPGAFVCECSGSWTGVVCDEPFNACDTAVCNNSGICVPDETAVDFYTCDCNGTDFEGPTCDVQVNDCSSNPCQNEGICIDALLSFSCNCSSGFTDVDCSTTILACDSSPCENAGTCYELADGAFGCDCISLYTGPICETAIDLCASSPCQNDGICTKGVCDCAGTGFEDMHCSTEVDECTSSPCLNGGVCLNLDPTFYGCDCTNTGYNGSLCETLMPVRSGTSSNSCSYTRFTI